MLFPFALLTTPPQQNDLVVMNARIWTDGRRTAANCMAIDNGRITYVGRYRRSLVTNGTRVVDVKNRYVVPGLIDSHTHLVESGPSLVQLELRDAKSQADFLRRIREYAAKVPKGQWVVGAHWSAESWPEKTHPSLKDLDAAVGDHPAVFVRMDGHSILVNSQALQRAKITKDGPPDPAGGVIDREPDGNPTGMLRETAQGLVPLPDPTDAEIYIGLKAAIRMANRYGVTAVSDICSPRYVAAWRRYLKESNPSMRAGLYFRANNWRNNVAIAKSVAPVPGWMRVNGIKAYMDGSLGSRTAFMNRPFTEQLAGKPETWRGVPMPGAVDGTYAQGFRLAADNNLQVIVHAIGDQANHDVLDMFAKIPNVQQRRFRIEHVQHLLPADYPRFRQLGIIASIQPYHKADDGRYCERVIGKERSRSSYAFRSLLKHGATLAFGSDWDVVTIDPFVGIRTAVTGRIMTGKIWQPQENISFDQALLAYTRNAAYAMGWEKEIGSLKPGYRADFVILNGDPYRGEASLNKVKAGDVFVEGRRVFDGARTHR